jgi:hypothetical protein
MKQPFIGRKRRAPLAHPASVAGEKSGGLEQYFQLREHDTTVTTECSGAHYFRDAGLDPICEPHHPEGR